MIFPVITGDYVEFSLIVFIVILQVVSAGSGSVITMWMIETGQKVKQVHKPIPESRITRTELQAHVDKHISTEFLKKLWCCVCGNLVLSETS